MDPLDRETLAILTQPKNAYQTIHKIVPYG
jgi:hypothetical protein